MVRAATSFVLVFLLTRCSSAPPVHFCREELTFTIREHAVLVQGEYFFKNLTHEAKIVQFFYPFVLDTNQHYPDTIELNLPFAETESGLTFALSIPGHTESSFRIRFSQPVSGRSYRYMTTTTRVWKRPIEKAIFRIIGPDTLDIKTNYAGRRLIGVTGDAEYVISIDNFYPDQDIVIEWR